MITFNTRHTIDEKYIDNALHKLVTAHARLGLPLVITDTWYLDGKPIPHQHVLNAIWRYERLHGGLHEGISFAHEPLARPLNEVLTQLCKNIDNHIQAEEFNTPRYSLVKEDNHTASRSFHTAKPGPARQSRAFAKMHPTAAALRHYAHYFDVLTWRWVYNTVYRDALRATENEARKLDPT